MYYWIKYRRKRKSKGKKRKYHRVWVSSLEEVGILLWALCQRRIEAQVCDQRRNIVGMVNYSYPGGVGTTGRSLKDDAL